MWVIGTIILSQTQLKSPVFTGHGLREAADCAAGAALRAAAEFGMVPAAAWYRAGWRWMGMEVGRSQANLRGIGLGWFKQISWKMIFGVVFWDGGVVLKLWDLFERYSHERKNEHYFCNHSMERGSTFGVKTIGPEAVVLWVIVLTFFVCITVYVYILNSEL